MGKGWPCNRRHMTIAKKRIKPINTGISNICSIHYKPKPWELNYPALAFC